MSEILPNALLLHPTDTVAITLRTIEMGQTVADTGIVVRSHIARSHKVAISAIAAGDHVHTHNLGMAHIIKTMTLRSGAWHCRQRKRRAISWGIGVKTDQLAPATTLHYNISKSLWLGRATYC